MKAFAMMAEGIPHPIFHPIKARLMVRFYDKMPGLLGVSLGNKQKDGIVLAFATLPHAEKAKEKIVTCGLECGIHIMNAEIDNNTGRIKILGPVDGWPEGCEADA